VENYGDMLRSACAAELEKSARDAALANLHVETAVMTGSPAEELVARAPEETSLIVAGGRGLAHGPNWLVGSVTERLARISPWPLLVVRHASALDAWLAGERRLDVVMATDLTAISDFALERASTLAELGPCDVELTYIEYPPIEHERLAIPMPIRRGLNPLIENVLDAELKKRAATVNLGGDVHTHTIRTFGRTAPRIAEFAEGTHADLVVVGTHQRKGFSRLWHESVAHGVLHGLDANVLCIPFHAPGEAASLAVPAVRTILAATDFSPCGNRAVAWAMANATTNARVAILHVVSEQEEADDATTRLAALQSDTWPAGVCIDRQVLTGANAAFEIAGAAERMSADLIVIGHHGHSRLSLLLGSTAGEVLARTRRPVLVVNDDALAVKRISALPQSRPA
jgi:nucleotide-binding universal stress UspA family protein